MRVLRSSKAQPRTAGGGNSACDLGGEDGGLTGDDGKEEED